MPKLLPIEDVCQLLQHSDRAVYEMLRQGKPPGAAKVSGKWRVDPDKLLAWIAKGGELADAAPGKAKVNLAALVHEPGLDKGHKGKGGGCG